MRNLVAGIIVGLVVGVVVGTTVIAPRLKLPAHRTAEAKQAEADRGISAAAPAPGAAGVPRPPPDTESVTWRMASAYASSLPQTGELGVRLETTLWRLSGGVFRLKLHEPGTLAAGGQMFEAVRSRAIEAAFAAPAFWAGKNPAFHLYSAIPFGPPLPEYLSWFYAGGGRRILEDLYKKQGLRGMVCGALAPAGSGWFRKPVDSLEEFKALRLGMGGLGGMVARKLGVRTMSLDEGDVSVALEKGMIDGAEASQPAIDMSLGLHKIARHYYVPGWRRPATLLHLIVNAEAWESLAQSRRAQLRSACAGNVAHGLAMGEARQFGALKEFTKQGIQIHAWPPGILAALRTAWTRTRTGLAKKNRDFRRTWNSLAKFREEYAIWREISAGAPPD